MDSHDYNVFTGVKIEIFLWDLIKYFCVNNTYVNTGTVVLNKILEMSILSYHQLLYQHTKSIEKCQENVKRHKR